MTTDYLRGIQDEILVHLGTRPMTIADLCDTMNLPYTTVQQAHKALRDENKIVKFDRKDRNARYTIGNNTGPKDIVPIVTLNGVQYKMTRFVGAKNLGESAQQAAEDIMKVWATIAMTAERLNDGVPNEIMVKRLNAQKVELAKSRNMLEHLAFFASQLIDNPKLWDTNYLIRFPDDKDWPEFHERLEEFYNYFYSKDN